MGNTGGGKRGSQVNDEESSSSPGKDSFPFDFSSPGGAGGSQRGRLLLQPSMDDTFDDYVLTGRVH